jgi:hypothetical protein
MIVTSPSLEGGESDVDISLVSANTMHSIPIIVTIGGIKKVNENVVKVPVLNLSVTIDSTAATLSEARKFCSKLQFYLNNPHLLDDENFLKSIN